MKIIIFVVVSLLLSGCASLQSPRESGISVEALLDQIQIAINEINAEKNPKSSLPPFKSAEVKLSTKSGITTEGKASLVLSGEKSRASTDSNILTLELVPDTSAAKAHIDSTGHQIAEYVISAVLAVDSKDFLKLNSLTVEAGLEVKNKLGGGIEVELVGVGDAARARRHHHDAG